MYQRVTGYFSANVLALAARGLGKLIDGGGRMELIVGCTLQAREVEEIEKGYGLRDMLTVQASERWKLEATDELSRERLGWLAWLDEAVAAHDRALAIDPGDAEVHVNRGIALRDLGRFEEALAACDKAIDLDPRNAVAHYSRGNVLISDDDIEGAIEAYHEAIRLQPNFVEPYCNLGHALVRQGRFQEAVPVFRRAHELGSKRAGWAHPSARWLEDAERRAELQGRQAQMLEGKAQPRDAAERIEFALALYTNARHAESARMYAEAFAEDASLAEDPAQSHCYNAARSAALAAATGGADAAEWRGRALEWLRADLEARENALTGLADALEHWKVDPDFASVRERLGDLPEPERAEWRDLWAAVDLALKSARLAAN
jgi:tetratricopeptide (TPR) repeat protein